MANGRFDYVKYDDVSATLQSGFKEVFDNLAKTIEAFGPSRSQSLALTKLEESYMWIGKMIRDHQVKRDTDTKPNERREPTVPPPSVL